MTHGAALTRSPRRRLRASALVVPAAFLAAIALLAACTTSTDAAGDDPAAAPSPGVTDDSVTVGYIAVDIGELSEQLGFVTVPDGGYDTVARGIQAVVDYVNQQGGVGGRTLNAVIRPYDAQLDTPEYAESICRFFTQDQPAFAVVLDAQFQNNARPCYRQGRAIMLDQTLVAHDNVEYEQFAPFLWSPSTPVFDRFLTTQLEVLQGAAWFDGAQGVAIIYPDSEVTRRTAQSVARPFLAGLGITNVAEYPIDSSNAGSLGATTGQALSAAAIAGIDRVLVVGGARVTAVMLAGAEAAQLDARYSISTYDSPAFFVDNPDVIVSEARTGMAGIGFAAASDARLDSSAEPFPDPARPNEGLCKQIIDGAGAAPPEGARENYRFVLQYCDATLLLKAALDRAPRELSPAAFRDAVWGLGTTWQSAVAYGSGWSPGQYAGVTQVRGMLWDDNCTLTGRTAPGCFRFGTGPLPLSSATPAPAAP